MVRHPLNVTTIDQLCAPGLGGLAILKRPVVHSAQAETKYKQSLAALDRFKFWQSGAQVAYRPKQGLWLPQKRAIAFAHAYRAIQQTLPGGTPNEAALIKMPTGTGKTAIIATLACASAITARTLVISPRAALVHQLRRDLAHRFWRRFDAIYLDGELREDLKGQELDRLAAQIDSGKLAPVRQLNADHYAEIYSERQSARQIVVSTFNALHLVLGVEPPAHRSMYGREARPLAKSLRTLGEDEDELNADAFKRNEQRFRQAIENVDLVIVDEGHHEPAYSWAQAVRQLNKPTVILTATPYRNDYKYFQAEGNFTFNLPWQEAVDHKLIRDVKFVGLTPAATASAPGPANAASYTEKAFAADCMAVLKKLPKGKKAIVHAANFGSLKRLQRAFWAKGEATVLIHHRVFGAEVHSPDLKTQTEKTAIGTLRFQHVKETENSNAAQSAKIWMHESKLLEGIDRDTFIEVWLYDGFGTSRELVQQVGRAIRRPDPDDKTAAVATVRGSAKRLDKFRAAPTVAKVSSERWNNYLAFEAYFQSNPETAFTAETQLLATLKRTAPAIQYVAGEFRSGHLLEEMPAMAAFRLPRRGMFCRIDGITQHTPTVIGSAFLDKIETAAAEAMELEERFDIRKVLSEPAFQDIRLIRYLAWSNSRYLARHHIPEWRLGLMAIVRAGRYLVLLDTEGLCLDTSRFGLLQPEPQELQRLFPKKGTRIVETDAVGLDMNERGLRSLSVRRHALEETYFDIAESSQAPTSVSGFGPLNGRTARRRVSFLRSTIADASSRPIALAQYIAWAKSIGDVLADPHVHGHAYFGRFAKRVPPLDTTAGAPQSILLDLWDVLDVSDETYAERHWDSTQARNILELSNTCYEIHARVANKKPQYFFNFEVEHGAAAPRQYEVLVEYAHRTTVPPTGRYRLVSAQLNDALTNDVGEDAEAGAFNKSLSPSLSGLINQDQSFRIIPAADGVIYANGHFYRPEVGADVLSVLETAPEVAAAISEKGDTRLTARARWPTQTLFGLTYGWFDGGNSHTPLAKDLRNCDFLICCDGNSEIADFIAVNDNDRRIFIIHAKAHRGPANASARNLQDVARQAQACLAFAGSSRQAIGNMAAWGGNWSCRLRDAGDAVVTKPRLIGKQPITAQQAEMRVRAALADPSYSKEIIILTAGLLSRVRASNAIVNRTQLDLQFIYYLASLRTSFDRSGVQLRIVANP